MPSLLPLSAAASAASPCFNLLHNLVSSLLFFTLLSFPLFSLSSFFPSGLLVSSFSVFAFLLVMVVGTLGGFVGFARLFYRNHERG